MAINDSDPIYGPRRRSAIRHPPGVVSSATLGKLSFSRSTVQSSRNKANPTRRGRPIKMIGDAVGIDGEQTEFGIFYNEYRIEANVEKKSTLPHYIYIRLALSSI